MPSRLEDIMGEPNQNNRIYSQDAMSKAIKDYNRHNKYNNLTMSHGLDTSSRLENRIPILENQLKNMTAKIELMEEFLIYKGIIEEGEFQEFVECKQAIEDL